MTRKITMVARDNLGSRAKFRRFFKAIYPEMAVVSSPESIEDGLAIVFGDCDPAWKRLTVPYILIENDVATMRSGGESEDEKRMVEGARLIVTTSENFADYLISKYRCPRIETVWLRPMIADLEFEPLPRLPGKHLVYAGGVEPADWRGKFLGYRAHHASFKKFIQAGWKVHVYTHFGSAHTGGYEAIGCTLHPAVPDGKLYRELSQYTAGFQGSNRNGVSDRAFSYAQACRPNKIWMYLAAGIPTLGYDGGSSMEIYDGKWGYELNTLNDISWLDRKLEEPRPNLGLDLGLWRLREVMDLDLKRTKKAVEGLF